MISAANIQSVTDLVTEHKDYWIQYMDSGLGIMPATPYLVSLGIALIAGLVLAWIAWRIVSWPFKKLFGGKETSGSTQENTLSLLLPEDYKQWPITIQDSYLKAQLFLVSQVQKDREAASEAIVSLSEKDTSKALHFLGIIRDDAQRKGDTKLQINAMRFSSALAFPNNIDLAKQTIEDTLRLAPNEPIILLQNGDIALRQKKVKEAFQSYSHALKISREKDHAKGQASALTILGALYFQQKDTATAEKLLTESISITQKLQNETKDPSWSQMTAKNYIIIGKIKQAQQKFTESRQNYDQGIAIKETLVANESSSQSLNQDIYLTSILVGDMLNKQEDLASAQDYYQKALAVSNTLMQQHPEQANIQRDHAIALNKLGQNDLHNKNTDAALKNFTASLGIRQSLLSKSPDNIHLSRDVAIGHERLGDLHSLSRDFSSATPHFITAKNTMEGLLAKDSNNLLWQEDLARYISRIAYIQDKSGETEQAILSLEQVIGIKENVLKKIPGHIRISLSLTNSYIILAKLDKKNSRPSLEKTLALLKSLLEKNKLPQSSQGMIADVEKQLASLG